MKREKINQSLKIISAIGSLVFAILFLITFIPSVKIELATKSFIQNQISHELHKQQEKIITANKTGKLPVLANQLGLKNEHLYLFLEDDWSIQVAAIMADMCGYDCETRKAVMDTAKQHSKNKIQTIKIADASLSGIIRGKYLKIVKKLKTDIRLFLGSNAFLLFILLFALYFKPQNTRHLVLPAILLLTSIIISVLLYTIGQNWFYTIIFNSYMGFTYLAYTLVIFILFCDIILNHALMVSTILDAIVNLVDSICP